MCTYVARFLQHTTWLPFSLAVLERKVARLVFGAAISLCGRQLPLSVLNQFSRASPYPNQRPEAPW